LLTFHEAVQGSNVNSVNICGNDYDQHFKLSICIILWHITLLTYVALLKGKYDLIVF